MAKFFWSIFWPRINGIALKSVPQVTSGPAKQLVKQRSFHYPELAKASKSWIKDQQKVTHIYAHIIHQKEEIYFSHGEGMATDRIRKDFTLLFLDLFHPKSTTQMLDSYSYLYNFTHRSFMNFYYRKYRV